jgi:hypothetical protein
VCGLFASHLSSDVSVSLKAKSCINARSRYSEAIHHLYASNSFVTIDSTFVLYLPRLFLPQRIACIRSFRFKWDRIWGPASYDEEDPLKRRPNYLRVSWNTIWKNLAEMRGLNELRVKLIVVDHRAWENIGKEKAIALFEPVMEVTSPSFFELVLPFACKSDEAPWNALPCHIRLTTNIDDGVQLI